MKPPELTLHKTLFALLAGVLLTVGCNGTEESSKISPAENDELVYYASACEQFTVPHGFELHWEWFNHRISYMKMRPSKRENCQPTHLDAGFVGGSFSTGAFFEDTPHISYMYQPVRSQDPAKMIASRVTLSADIGPDGTVSGSKYISRRQTGLDNYDQVVALIEGISFHTGVEQESEYPTKYNPSNGYTMRGIGARARVTALTPDEIELDYGLKFETGIAPDWRPNMNKARQHARVRGHLDVLLVGFNDVPVHRNKISYDVAYPEPTFGNREQEPPNGDRITQTMTGQRNEPAGMVGLSQWEFDMEFPIDCDEDSDCPGGETCVVDKARCTNDQGPLGDYIKTLQVSVRQTDFDPQSGQATFEVVGYASNSSTGIVFAPLEYQFDAEIVWAQTTGAADPRQIVRNRFNTGETTIELEQGPFEAGSQRASAQPAKGEKQDEESEQVAD